MGYNELSPGSQRIFNALANHINRLFEPHVPLGKSNFINFSGVTSLISVFSTILTDPGDAILLDGPIYGAFNIDLVTESGANLAYVSMGLTSEGNSDGSSIDQFSTACVERYETALKQARTKGLNVRVLLLCNPHNPLGGCYTADALRELMAFCEREGLHLVSDEIYALCVFRDEDKQARINRFTSVLAIDTTGLIDPGRVHVLYGHAKDFAAAGLRFACLISHNDDMLNAARLVSRFHAPSEISACLVAQVLEDHEFVDSFLAESRRVLARDYRIATQVLDEAGISYYKATNAGFFIWFDLVKHVRTLASTNGTGQWEAERALKKKILDVGVVLASCEDFGGEEPGWFRVIFTNGEESIREGFKRYVHQSSMSTAMINGEGRED